METHIGIVGIILHKREEAAPKVNQVLTDFGDIIVGRMGMPYNDRQMHVITLIVDGKDSAICKMTSQLEAIEHVTVKTSTAKCDL